MSRAICKNKDCGAINYWRGQRGRKLADLQCGICGGDLEAFSEKKHGKIDQFKPHENRKITSAVWRN